MSAPESTAPKLTVMVVDDEDSVRSPLNMVLKPDFNVVLCNKPEDALRTMKSQPVHIAILDIMMGAGESGLDLLRTLKEIDPLLEVIMLTGFETVDAAKQAMRLGACDFQSKPFKVTEIMDAVMRAMKLREQNEKARASVERAQSLDPEVFQFQAGVIHDVSNMMTVVTGSVEMLKFRLQQKPSLDAAEVLSLRSTVEQLSRQVDMSCGVCSRHLRLMRSSRDLSQTDAVAILENIASALPSHHDAKHTKIVVDLASRVLPDIEAPVVDSFQLVLNLALNAAQSSATRHEIVLAAKPFFTQVPVHEMRDSSTTRVVGAGTFKNRAPLVVISVTDRGYGINPDTLSKLFGTNVTTKPKGTGVGLRFIGTLVARHNLLLHLRTEPGGGTTVSVFFPARA